ncbi:MAG: tetratricopeptide repeat protein [Methylococcaceae bacterium]|nr:tetratricopeptide repeat protein [Methylococcaceae bacterium]
MARDDFSTSVKDKLSKRVAFHCSNPTCDVPTISASDESSSSVNNVGIAAHICAAASGKGARRYKSTMTPEQRSSIENGIWLCATCATLIDRDEITYTEELLEKWKSQAIEKAKSRLGQKLYSKEEIDESVAVYAKQHDVDAAQIKGLTVAVTALSQKGELGSAAIEAFKNDKLDLAKELFKQETQRAEIAAKQGTEAYRNLGALAFLDNTQEALNASRRATELDSDNADGWNQLGHLLNRVGELDNAIVAYQKVLSLGQSHQDQKEIAMAYGHLAIVYSLRGDLDESIEMHTTALRLNEALGDKRGVAVNYGNLGGVHTTRNDLDNSLKMFQKALQINEELNNQEGLAANYGNLGCVYLKKGELDKGINMLQKSLKLHLDLGCKVDVAQNYNNLGMAYGEQGNLDVAVDMYEKSLCLNKELGRKQGMAINYGTLAGIHHKRNDVDKTIEMSLKSLNISKELGLKGECANSYTNLGSAYSAKGDVAEARRYYKLAIDLFKSFDSHNLKIVQGKLDKLNQQAWSYKVSISIRPRKQDTPMPKL